jgi:hypothetical protein
MRQRNAIDAAVNVTGGMTGCAVGKNRVAPDGAVGKTSRMGQEKRNTICFVVDDAETNVVGFCYRVWAAGTSFYIKIRNIDLAVKISVHGPDPRHGGTGAFKLGLDASAAGAAHETLSWHLEPGAKMGWFPGVDLGDSVTHLARFRIPWNTLQRGAPSAPLPTTSSSIGRHFRVAAPAVLHAADIDLYLSENGVPYWPDAEQRRRDNSAMGPLTNNAGQILTAAYTHRSLWRDPDVAAKEATTGQFSGPLGRYLSSNLDPSGFLWIREIVAPASMFRRYDAEEMRTFTQVSPYR